MYASQISSIALGLHPLVKDVPEREFQLFEELLDETSYIGEIGVDLSREGRATGAAQVTRFQRVLRLIRGKPKVLSLHTRGADKVVLDLLAEHGIKGAIFHWYSGTIPDLEQIIAAGHYLSINPSMTRTTKGQEVIRSLPQDRVLTESDGPHAKDGKRPLQPWDVETAVEYLAGVWGGTPEEAGAVVWGNFGRVLAPVRNDASTSHPTMTSVK